MAFPFGALLGAFELAIRCALNRVGKSTDIQRLGPNLDRAPRECIRDSAAGMFSLGPSYARLLDDVSNVAAR